MIRNLNMTKPHVLNPLDCSLDCIEYGTEIQDDSFSDHMINTLRDTCTHSHNSKTMLNKETARFARASAHTNR